MTPPSDFTCPITNKLMVDPVLSPQGINFERSAILKWTRDGNNLCPVTNAPLRLESLRTSTALQWKIKYFQMKDTTSFDEIEEQEQEPNDHVVIPQNMMCPLTKKVMVDPVMTKYGHNYERAAIIKWIGMRGEVCPMTGKPLSFSGIVANSKLWRQIVNWERKIKNGDVAPQLPNKLKVVHSCPHRMERDSRGLVEDFLKTLHVIPEEREGSQGPTPLDRIKSDLLILEDVLSTLLLGD
jgi:hypothetical protein